MDLFWVIAVVLVVGVFAMLLPALLRPNSTVKTDANAEKRQIFRQQFDEIDQDKTNGVLDATQYEIAKSEMQRRMLDEIGETTTASIQVTQPDRRLAISLLVLLPLAAFLIYFKIGNPASILIKPISPEAIVAQTNAEHSAMAGDILPLLNSLKNKLEKNPGDGTGWAL